MSTQALAKTNEAQPQGFLSLNQMVEVAKYYVESGIYPKWNTIPKMVALMNTSQAEGRPAVECVNRYDFIQGTLRKRPEAMLCDFLDAGGEVEWHELNDKVAEATFTPPGGKPFRHAYTWDEVLRAGLQGKDNYRHYPTDMLRSRLIGRALRTVWPKASGRFYTPEENVPSEINVTPAQAMPTQAMFGQAPAAPQIQVMEAELVTPEPVAAGAGEPNTLAKLRDLGEAKVVAYLRSLGWLAADGELETVGETKLAQIEKRFAAFAAKVEGFAATQAPAGAQAEGGAK